jgi:hypothetical protein
VGLRLHERNFMSGPDPVVKNCNWSLLHRQMDHRCGFAVLHLIEVS